jgi:hypothetical protein
MFCFWFFSWISFPQAPDYTIRAVSNFFENSRRYSQLQVHHWFMQKKNRSKKSRDTVPLNLSSSIFPSSLFLSGVCWVMLATPKGWWIMYRLSPPHMNGFRYCNTHTVLTLPTGQWGILYTRNIILNGKFRKFRYSLRRCFQYVKVL